MRSLKNTVDQIVTFIEDQMSKDKRGNSHETEIEETTELKNNNNSPQSKYSMLQMLLRSKNTCKQVKRGKNQDNRVVIAIQRMRRTRIGTKIRSRRNPIVYFMEKIWGQETALREPKH